MFDTRLTGRRVVNFTYRDSSGSTREVFTGQKKPAPVGAGFRVASAIEQRRWFFLPLEAVVQVERIHPTENIVVTWESVTKVGAGVTSVLTYDRRLFVSDIVDTQ